MSSPVVLSTIGAEMEPTTLPPPESVAEMGPSARPGQPIESRKTPLLVLVEGSIQRICGVRQFLQGRPGIGKGCGALPQALYGVVGARRIAPRADPVEPKLAELARGLLEGRRSRNNGLPHRFPPAVAPSFATIVQIEMAAGSKLKLC